MLVVKIIIGLLACVASAICMRAGGMAKNPDTNPKWIPMWMRESWVRDWICPLFVYGSLLLFWQPDVWYGWILLIVCYPLLAASLSTYWDFLFGYDNYYFSGFVAGISCFLLAFCGIPWWVILIRGIFMAVSWGLWCKFQTNDVKSEMGRGVFLVL